MLTEYATTTFASFGELGDREPHRHIIGALRVGLIGELNDQRYLCPGYFAIFLSRIGRRGMTDLKSSTLATTASNFSCISAALALSS